MYLIYQLKQRNIFVTVGDDEDLQPLIKVWNCDKRDKSGSPSMARSIRASVPGAKQQCSVSSVHVCMCGYVDVWSVWMCAFVHVCVHVYVCVCVCVCVDVCVSSRCVCLLETDGIRGYDGGVVLKTTGPKQWRTVTNGCGHEKSQDFHPPVKLPPLHTHAYMHTQLRDKVLLPIPSR